jgi:hypothetical protein
MDEDIQPNNAEPMEVHHHPDLKHEKKNIREYFLEFLMIFLAVSLGFIAENLREHFSDRSKEKEYIESMLQDLKTDTAQCNRSIRGTTRQMHGLDTLEILLTPDVNKNDSVIFICYRQSESLYNEHTMNFSSRTIAQLSNTGNMRLIKNQEVANRISAYYTAIGDLEAQKSYYKQYFQKCLGIFQELYEFDPFHSRITAENEVKYPPLVFGKFKIANTRPDDLNKFKSTFDLTKGIIGSYRDQILRLKIQATSLLGFLKEKYDLEDR